MAASPFLRKPSIFRLTSSSSVRWIKHAPRSWNVLFARIPLLIPCSDSTGVDEASKDSLLQPCLRSISLFPLIPGGTLWIRVSRKRNEAEVGRKRKRKRLVSENLDASGPAVPAKELNYNNTSNTRRESQYPRRKEEKERTSNSVIDSELAIPTPLSNPTHIQFLLRLKRPYKHAYKRERERSIKLREER